MGINIGTNNVTKMFIGNTPVDKIYLGGTVVYELATTVNYIFAGYTNGLLSTESQISVTSGKDKDFVVTQNSQTSTLTIYNANNTAGADQVISISVNGETKVDHATWGVGTVGEAYPFGTGTLQWSYPKDYQIKYNITTP